MDAVKKYTGETFIDQRGFTSFNNDFDLKIFRRSYIVESFSKGQIRAWHGHKEEVKAVVVLNGAVRFCATEISDFANPNPNSEIITFYLASNKYEIVVVPGGYANGFQALTDKARLIFFSSSTLDESLKDDFRYQFNYWNPWEFSNY
jgi:dTDP-4-dehydrorhamnose 3,5-epimerase-like enzyme